MLQTLILTMVEFVLSQTLGTFSILTLISIVFICKFSGCRAKLIESLAINGIQKLWARKKDFNPATVVCWVFVVIFWDNKLRKYNEILELADGMKDPTLSVSHHNEAADRVQAIKDKDKVLSACCVAVSVVLYVILYIRNITLCFLTFLDVRVKTGITL
jgi:hypothetical protein